MVVTFLFGGRGILQTGFPDDPRFSPAELVPFPIMIFYILTRLV